MPISIFDPADTATENNTNTQKENNTMAKTEDTQNKIVATLKGGSGFDAPWVVVHADTPAEAKEILDDEQFKEFLDLVGSVGGYFAKTGPSKPAQGGNNGAAPAPAQQAPNGQTPPPGYVFKSGIGKNGKPWKAFMAADRNSGLDPIWL